MFGFESIVEAFGDLFHVERCTNPDGHVRQCEASFFFNRKRQGLQLLDERLTGLSAMVCAFAASDRLAWFFLYPLPDLCGLVPIQEDDDVFVGKPGDLPVNLSS